MPSTFRPSISYIYNQVWFSVRPSSECPDLPLTGTSAAFTSTPAIDWIYTVNPSCYTQSMPVSVMSVHTHEEGCAEYCTCTPPPVYSRTPSGSGSAGRQSRSRYDAQEAAVRARRRRPHLERAPRSRASEIAWPSDAPSRAKLLTYSFEGKLAYVPAAPSHEVRIRRRRDDWIFTDVQFRRRWRRRSRYSLHYAMYDGNASDCIYVSSILMRTRNRSSK